MTWIEVLAVLFSAVAAYTDLRVRKIYNLQTFSMIVIGILAQVYFNTPSFAVFGLITALMVFILPYFFKFLGAGDVKFLMGLGALLGNTVVLNIALHSILIGGAMGLFQLIKNRKLADFIMRLKNWYFLKHAKVAVTLDETIDHNSKLPFAVPMLLAVLYEVGKKAVF